MEDTLKKFGNFFELTQHHQLQDHVPNVEEAIMQTAQSANPQADDDSFITFNFD